MASPLLHHPSASPLDQAPRIKRFSIHNGFPSKSDKTTKEIADEPGVNSTVVNSLELLLGFPELEELSITGMLVDSIAPLMELMSLEKPELSAGRIPHSEINRFMQLNPAGEVIIKH